MDGKRSRPPSVTSAAPGYAARVRARTPAGRLESPGPRPTLSPQGPGAPGPPRAGGSRAKSRKRPHTWCPWAWPGRRGGGGAPDGSSLPTHPLPACAPVPDLSVFLGHIFLTCCYRPPLRSHSSCSFCTPSGSSLVPRAPGAGTRTLEHLLSSDRRVFGFYCLSVPKWENPDTAPL